MTWPKRLPRTTMSHYGHFLERTFDTVGNLYGRKSGTRRT
jgi:hypothetical protein